jgi:hypothetical protein
MRQALRTVGAPRAARSLFVACGRLSTEAYEQGEAKGSLLLCTRGHPSVEVLLELVDPVPVRSARAARKVFQLSHGRVMPLCDGASIWGVGRAARRREGVREDPFEVRFCGGSRWQLLHAGEVLFEVTRQRPMLRRRPPVARERFGALVRTVFPDHRETRAGRLWGAVSAVLATGCGSTLEVSSNATG